MNEDSLKVVATNRRAAHDYFLDERFEAGLALQGSEIKSIRAGKISLREAYVRIEDGQAWLVNAHIAPYDPASQMNHDPLRPRRLLLHRREIAKLAGVSAQRGFALIPTRVYLRKGRAKLEFALGKGKRRFDKRQDLARRDAEREMARGLARRGR
jgi:SsrA-binding protein